MSEGKSKMVIRTEIAKPLPLQQLERSLNIEPFLSFVEDYLQQPLRDDDASSTSETELFGVDSYSGETVWNQSIVTSKQDRKADKERLYNFTGIKTDRRWLQDILLSDSTDSSGDEVTEDDLKIMLKEHLLRKRFRSRYYLHNKNRNYQYYGAGLLSNYDKYAEYQSTLAELPPESHKRKRGPVKKEKGAKKEGGCVSEEAQDHDPLKEETVESKRGRKPNLHKKKATQAKNAEILAHRRRKIWAVMAKKELGKVQRAKLNNHKEMMTSCRRVANYCMRHWRQKAMQSQKNMKEVVWRAKRLTREMQGYWKRYERVERETRRRMEKEAEEQRKLDIELMEAKRQQRKLNFLITQTELYAHFMSRKLGGGSTQEQLRILSQLEEETNPRLAAIDEYDCELAKEKVRQRVEQAFSAEEARSREFEPIQPPLKSEGHSNEDKPQPNIFRGKLKGYQIKGMTWLVNLYDQGINGILADEMGLGKTVQSIAFLCHIAEKYSVWGPFLIISPASTLHNWQQEMARFVPDFNVVPYWGNPQERKILRQFWDQKGIHTKEASFHVVITSYQLVITDFKYFNRIKWQYLILDEAQAIKSTSSMRWKLLLGFNCRNRLLLSGTPIQNSMAELWALLHFIMPTMFDSHDEFNEWFSKDIESHAENKTSIDEKHLSRLHMILKPFMLRRIKSDVENELSDKIEMMVYCPLTTRQKMLYAALKKKIRIEDLLHSSGPYQTNQCITSNLMNLVMQFRKVCNHPELFERREARSPFSIRPEDYVVARLVTECGLVHKSIPSKNHILYNLFCIFYPHYVQSSLFPSSWTSSSSCFAFTRLMGLGPSELYNLTIGGLLYRWLYASKRVEEASMRAEREPWDSFKWPNIVIARRKLPSDLTFTSPTSDCVYTHTAVSIHSMPETLEHRWLRSRKAAKLASPVDTPVAIENGVALISQFPHTPKPPLHLDCFPVTLPSFLYNNILKVESRSRAMYSWGSRSWAWTWHDHLKCDSLEGRDAVYFGSPSLAAQARAGGFHPVTLGGLIGATPPHGWSNIVIPDKQTLVTDAGKLTVLDGLLTRLKEQGHRVLIYSQMTRMIDLLEEYMWFRKHTYMRLDGSSKISDRRDMVADFQTREDIFVFLLSTRAGGLGINLTAADTVIFYDSDWNPTVDQQAMDRAHRLGQTKQVTVYRLICKESIEERILQRAREKSEIQRMVISGGNFKPDTLKPKEVVSLLLDDAEIEQKYRQKQAERRLAEESRQDVYRERDRERKRKNFVGSLKDGTKHYKTEDGIIEVTQIETAPSSPTPEGTPNSEESVTQNSVGIGVNETDLVSNSEASHSKYPLERVRAKRGRPRGSRRGGLQRPPPAQFSHMSSIAMVKRGPGRPRLKPVGPSHQGTRPFRGGSKKSLPVPIRGPQAPHGSSLQGPE